MEKQTIATLRELLRNEKLTEADIKTLKKDARKGVQLLLKQYEQKKHHEKQLEEKFIEMQWFEQNLYRAGNRYVAGVDEAGRGPLAGPVVAAAVILPPDFRLLGLDDSKLLNEDERERFATKIKNEALYYGISVIDNDVIDHVNIFHATKQAMLHSINKLPVMPDHALIDAIELSELPCQASAIIKGDKRSISIAAASILAKVRRDAIMKEIHNEAPAYDFSTNKGYPTKNHLETLQKQGASVYHRKSFAPVKNSIS